MKCKNCGEKTKVIDSRNKASTKARLLIKRKINFISQDDNIDFRWRERFCTSCDKVSYSIECYIDDIEERISEAKNGKKK